jgi:NAD-dependent deacetylase
MNIDGLHERAGSKNVINIHGTLDQLECLVCGKQYKFDDVEDFCCCGEPLYLDVVLYGDTITKLGDAFQLIDTCDHLIVVGTSFYTSTSEIIVEHMMKRQYSMGGGNLKITTINENAQEQLPKLLDKLMRV